MVHGAYHVADADVFFHQCACACEEKQGVMDAGDFNSFAYASLRHRVRLFSRGLVCYGGAWNAPWGGYRFPAFCAEK